MDKTDELDSDDVEIQEKKPFKRIKFAVDQLVNCAIPLHLHWLKAHHEKIKQFEELEDWTSLHSEQINASNTVRLLKNDIYELQCISSQVKDEDSELFQQKTEPATNDVLNALASFLELYPDVMSPHPKYNDSSSSSARSSDFPTLECNLDRPSTSTGNQQLIVENAQEVSLAEPLKVQKRWLKLRNELSELNELFKKFASLVFSHKQSVDSIDEHVQKAHDNVQEGTKHLRKAVVLQAAAFPATGAVIGGLLLGPVGAAVGFKLFGSMAFALSGCALGYGAGYKIKQKRQTSCDIEMKALTYSSKSVSLSSPDIVNLPDLSIPKIYTVDTD